MSANNLQKEIQHITKTAATNMDHSQIDELISNVLKKWTNIRQTLKKIHHILLWRQQVTIMKKPVITQTSILETAIALLHVVTLCHHIKILIGQPRNLKLLEIFLHHRTNWKTKT